VAQYLVASSHLGRSKDSTLLRRDKKMTSPPLLL